MITWLDTARRNRLLKSVPIGFMAIFIAKTLMSIEDLLGSSPMGISVLVPKGRRESQGEPSVIISLATPQRVALDMRVCS